MSKLYTHYGASLIRRSITRGPHFTGPQFTHWSALAVRKFWSAVYPLVSQQVRRSALYHSPATVPEGQIGRVRFYCYTQI